MQENLNKIKSIIYVNGKCASTRLSRSHFVSIGQESLFDWLIENTTFLSENSKIIERIWALECGLIDTPKCVVCGNIVPFNRETKRPKLTCSSECNRVHASTRNKEHWKRIDESTRKTISEKRKSTNLKRYGYEFNLSNRDTLKKSIETRISKFSEETINSLDDFDWLFEQYVLRGVSASEIADMLGDIHYSTVLDRLRNHNIDIRQSYNRSSEEIKMEEWLSQYTKVVHSHNLNKMEVDIFLPDFDIGIEYNGLFWHSYDKIETPTQKRKHLTKKEMFAESGIEIIHIDSESWNVKQDIWKSYILNRIGKSQSIHARKCEIVDVSNAESSSFLSRTHLQGSTPGSVKIGLSYEGKLVSVMTFGKPRYDKIADWELIRFSNELNTVVVGGFSKLMKYFRGRHTGSIISYADYSRSNGSVYLKNGFELIRKSDPGYYWIEKGIKKHHRSNFMKHKLKDKMKIFDPEKSESENMFVNDYRRYWDCGQLVYFLK